MYLGLSVLLLATALLSKSCQGQDLQGLKLQYERLESLEDVAYDEKEVMSALSDLWTVYFPQILQDTEELEELDFTQECVDSALAIWDFKGRVVPLPFGNGSITLPGPAIRPLLDASGKPGAGILSGNVIMNGAYDECFNYDFTGYCVAKGVHAPSLSSSIPFSVGLCVPKGCTRDDVALAINSTTLLLAQSGDIICTDTKYSSYSTGAKIMIAVCVIFALLVVCGSIIDFIVNDMPGFVKKHFKFKKDTGNDDTFADSPGSINNVDEKSSLLPQSVAKKDAKRRVNPLEFITAFSLFKTVPTLLATKQAPGVITSLNGLRVISMFWVILGHTHFWVFNDQIVTIDNFLTLISVGSRFSFQAIVSGFFSVDSFFFLSGVLVAYLTFRQMAKKGRFPFINYYVHRYLRLTPTYAFVIFFAWTLTTHLSYGPGLLREPFAEQCSKYWWTNLLYINNLYPWKLMDSCIGWSWYLSNDMQFYIISPLILIPVYYLFPVGLCVAAAMLVGSFIVTGALTEVYDFQANMFSFLAYTYVGKSATVTFSDTIYIKPWGRIAPYLVGLILGYIIFKGFRFGKLPRFFKLLFYVVMWCVACFVMFWLVYGLYFTWNGHVPNRFENFLYIVFSRFLWAVSLSVIVFACHNGYGWLINSFLSMKLWIPLARMTFNAYLLHPIVMTVIYGQLQISLHYTDITMACFVIVFTVVSYAAAGVLCLFVEFPLGTIEMLLFKLFGLMGRESQRQGNTNKRSNSGDAEVLKTIQA